MFFPRSTPAFFSRSLLTDTPADATPADRAGALHRAIADNDTNEARKIMNDTFWTKSDFRPDWLHLFHAVMQDNRDMARMLVTWGATFGREEAKTLARMAGDDWKKAVTILRGAGMRLEFSDDELAQNDHAMMVRMTRHALRYLPAQNHQEQFIQYLSLAFEEGFTNAVLARKNEEAFTLLNNAGLDPLKPIDISNILLNLPPEKMQSFLQNAQEMWLILKPVTASTDMLMEHPGTIEKLSKLGILADEQPARLALFTRLKDVTKKDDIVSAAKVLFNDRFPLTEEECEIITDSLKKDSTRRRIVDAVYADQLKKTLLEEGFFESPVWKAEKLDTMASHTITPSLKDEFTALATKRRLQSQPLKDFFRTDDTLRQLRQYMESGLAVMDAHKTQEAMKYLHDRSEKGMKTEDVLEIVKALRDNGSDFSRIDPMEFIGKQTPGLGKILLDLDIVETKHFELEVMLERSGKPFEIGKDKNHKRYAYTEFLCQLILENNELDKYKPLRMKADVCYQDIFRRDWIDCGRHRITFEQERRIIPQHQKSKRFPFFGRG